MQVRIGGVTFRIKDEYTPSGNSTSPGISSQSFDVTSSSNPFKNEDIEAQNKLYDLLLHKKKLSYVEKLFSNIDSSNPKDSYFVDIYITNNENYISSAAETFNYPEIVNSKLLFSKSEIFLNPEAIDKLRYYSEDGGGGWHEMDILLTLDNEFGNIAPVINPDLKINSTPNKQNIIFDNPVYSTGQDGKDDDGNVNINASIFETFSAETQDKGAILRNLAERREEYRSEFFQQDKSTEGRTSDTNGKTGSQSGNRDIWGASEYRSIEANDRKQYPPISSKPLEKAKNLRSEADKKISPLVLDIDGDGIEYISLEDSDTFWDIDVDGFAELTGWVSGSSGFLARDLNDDGFINNNSELFGSSIVDGFTELAELDSNSDGQISVSDADFGSLLIWIDANNDGISATSELSSLGDLGISAISLESNAVDISVAGNEISHVSIYTVTTEQGEVTRDIVDVWFAYDDARTIYEGSVDTSIRSFDLLNLRENGILLPLDAAMALDQTGSESLFELVEGLNSFDSNALFAPEFNLAESVEQILFTWAGVAAVEPNSRGGNIDGRELGFLEVFLGEPFLQRGVYENPFIDAGRILREAYAEVFDYYFGRILIQTACAELFTGSPEFDERADVFLGVDGLNIEVVQHLDPSAIAPAERLQYWTDIVRLVDVVIGVDALSGADYVALDAAVSASENGLSLASIVAELGFEEDIGGYYVGENENDVLTGGTAHDLLQGNGGDDDLFGMGGNDQLEGGASDDTLSGGFGSDFLLGGLGNDTYTFEIAHAFDTIQEEGNDPSDTIKFGAGIDFADLSFERASNNSDLIIYIASEANGGTQGVIAVADYFYVGSNFESDAQVEFIETADGAVFDLGDLSWSLEGTETNETLLGVQIGGGTEDTINGNGGIDRIFGFDDDDVLDGGSENDQLHGGSGNDTLIGGLGNDELRGGSGENVLEGGVGRDTLIGGPDNDIYKYFDGNDLFVEGGFGTGRGGVDFIELQSEFIAEEISFHRGIDRTLNVSLPTGNTIELRDHFYDENSSFDFLRFSDGSLLNLATVAYEHFGSEANNVLNGDAGNNTIFGLSGNDTLRGETGSDRLFGDDDDDQLEGGPGADFLDGGIEGDDTLLGESGEDRYFYGGGWDTIYDDGLIGEIDTLVLSIDAGPQELTFIESQNHLTLAFHDPLNEIEIRYQNYLDGRYEIENLIFSDGFEFSLSDRTHIHTAIEGSSETSGSAAADILVGQSWDETISGGDGQDSIHGGDGKDVLIGGPGADVLTTGQGADSIIGPKEDFVGDRITDFDASDTIRILDTLVPDSGVEILSGSALFYIDIDSDGIVDTNFILDGDFLGEIFEMASDNGDTVIRLANNETVQLSEGGERFISTDSGSNRVFGNTGDDVIGTAGGADIVSGGSGSDVLLAGAGDDVLIGGLGGDILTGGAGVDVFSFDIDDFAGAQVIADFITDFEVGVDRIELSGFGVSGVNDLAFQTVATGDAIILGDGAFIVLEGIDADALVATDIVAVDQGRKLSLASINNLHNLTAADDRFVTTDPGANVVRAGAGLDAVIGGDGPDILMGESGDDVLVGGAGNDRLIGGQGADRLTGRDGADSFEFTAGEETSFVAEFITDYEAVDTVVISGFGFNGVDDLNFTNVGTGDLALQLTDSRFVVFEGLSDAAELVGMFEFV